MKLPSRRCGRLRMIGLGSDGCRCEVRVVNSWPTGGSAATKRSLPEMPSDTPTHVLGNGMRVCPGRQVAQGRFADAAQLRAGEQVRDWPRSKGPLPHSGKKP